MSALVRVGDAEEFARLSGVEAMLKPHELRAFTAVRDHVHRHGTVPAPETCRAMGISLVEAPEPPSYYRDELVKRHVRLGLTQAVKDVNESLRGDPLGALSRFRDEVLTLGHTAEGRKVLDLRRAADIVVPRFVARMQGASGGLQTGWPTLDDMTGGIAGGELVSIVGRPKQGKTQLLLWIAMHVHAQGLPVLFVSMEMEPELIAERHAGIWASTALNEIRVQRGRAIEDLEGFEARLRELEKAPHPFHVVGGNLAETVGDVLTHAATTRPAAIFVDGAYLLTHPNTRVLGHQVIEQNVRLLKGKVATDLSVPVFATWQFNREGARDQRRRRGRKREASIEDIAGSDEIPKTSSILLALLEEDSPETLVKRQVRVMRGRGGESGRFQIAWDWERMDFSEWSAERLESVGWGVGSSSAAAAPTPNREDDH